MNKIVSDEYGKLILDEILSCDNLVEHLKLETVLGNVTVDLLPHTYNFKIEVRSKEVFIDAILFEHQYAFTYKDLFESISKDLFNLYFDLIDKIVSLINKIKPNGEPEIKYFSDFRHEIKNGPTYMLLKNVNDVWNGIIKTPQVFFYVKSDNKFNFSIDGYVDPVTLFYKTKNDILALYWNYKTRKHLDEIVKILTHRYKKESFLK